MSDNSSNKEKIKIFTKAIQGDPKNDENYFFRAVLYIEEGNFDLAIEDLNKSIELDPADSEKFYNRGFIYLLKGENQKAVEDFSEAIELKPKAITYAQRGAALSRIGITEMAIEDFTKAVELDENDDYSLYNRGREYLLLKKYEEALSDFKKAVEINDSKGVYYHNLGEQKEAIDAFSKSIELEPEYVPSYHSRGLVKFDLKNYEEALVDFNKAIELDEGFIRAYYFRGCIYHYIIGDYDNVIKDLTIYLNTHTDDHEALFMRAEAYLIQKKYVESIADITTLLGLKDDHSGSYKVRGMCYVATGERDKAKSDFEKVLELNPEDEEAKKYLKMLK